MELITQHYGRTNNLCTDEPFYGQPSGAFFSGVLVAPDLVLTAGHCLMPFPISISGFVPPPGCASTKIVFGFALRSKGKSPRQVASSQVYACKKVVASETLIFGRDWALIQLDRPVADHAPVSPASDREIKIGTPLFTIGHPGGLPAKFAGGGKVLSVIDDGRFSSDLDIFSGNSGGPVFDAGTGSLVGIVSVNAGNFITRGDCQVSKSVPPQAPGSYMTRVLAPAERLESLKRLAAQRLFTQVGERSCRTMRLAEKAAEALGQSSPSASGP